MTEAYTMVDQWQAILGSRWTLSVDDMSSHQVVMLDLILFRNKFNRLRYRPHIKPTALLVPLTPASAHPPSTHVWPLAETRRIARHSTSQRHFKHVFSKVFDAWKRFGIDKSILDAAKSFAPLGNRLRATGTRSGEDAAQENGPWLVLPWHPAFGAAGLSRVLRTAHSWWAEHLRSEDCWLPCSRVAWCNAQAPLHLVLRRLGEQTVDSAV